MWLTACWAEPRRGPPGCLKNWMAEDNSFHGTAALLWQPRKGRKLGRKGRRREGFVFARFSRSSFLTPPPRTLRFSLGDFSEATFAESSEASLRDRPSSCWRPGGPRSAPDFTFPGNAAIALGVAPHCRGVLSGVFCLNYQTYCRPERCVRRFWVREM